MIKYRASREVVVKLLNLFLDRPTKIMGYNEIRPELPELSESSIRRALQDLEENGILEASRPRGKPKNIYINKTYKLSIKPKTFENILKIFNCSSIEVFLQSAYVAYFIRRNSFHCVYKIIQDNLEDFEFKRKASKELFALKSTKEEYSDLRDIVIEYYKTYNKNNHYCILIMRKSH